MLIEFKKQRSWIVFTILSVIVAGGYYLFYWQQTLKNGGTGPSGATLSGLAYGLIGFLMMLFCGVLGARKLVRIWRLGRARDWLNAHIWLGLLAFWLILCHSGFLLGHYLTFWLMIVFIVVELTGIYGVVLQQYIPSIMLDMIKNESTYEQIPEVIHKLKIEAAVIVAVCCGKMTERFDAETLKQIEKSKTDRLKPQKDPDFSKKYTPVVPKTPEAEKAAQPLMTFFLEQVEPFIDPHYRKDSKLAELTRSKAVFAHIQTLLPTPLHEALADIQGLCEERRQLQLQVRLHWWLHSWEYVHVPLSYLLLAMSAFHVIIATWKYSGVLNK